VKKADLHRVIVDTAVSEKAITQGWSPARLPYGSAAPLFGL
jgi:hypothetical protein